jgi:hypothetical protein
VDPLTKRLVYIDNLCTPQTTLSFFDGKWPTRHAVDAHLDARVFEIIGFFNASIKTEVWKRHVGSVSDFMNRLNLTIANVHPIPNLRNIETRLAMLSGVLTL